MELGTIFSDVYQNSFMDFLVMFGQTHLVHLGINHQLMLIHALGVIVVKLYRYSDEYHIHQELEIQTSMQILQNYVHH